MRANQCKRRAPRSVMKGNERCLWRYETGGRDLKRRGAPEATAAGLRREEHAESTKQRWEVVLETQGRKFQYKGRAYVKALRREGE